MFDNIYRNKKVLITGHTGFKGSWLVLWLTRLGAEVTGYALPPPSQPSHLSLLDLDVESIMGDIRDRDNLRQVFREQQPEIVFHLAAQAIVRRSYDDPAETFSSNVMGTVNVLEAARECDTVRAIVNVTSDKCYDNREWVWGYRENDPLGGYDPYSASKGCAELVTNCWRDSFFDPADYGRTHETLLASARAGNVIGGGDWAADRLVPDIMRAVSKNEKVKIRNPEATRPWQHVLEPLSGYLLLGQKLLEGWKEFAEAWNFGPSSALHVSVGEIAEQVKEIWPKIDFEIRESAGQPHEAGKLNLDCSKARTLLKWSPAWDGKTAIENTVQWYRTFYESGAIKSLDDIHGYIDDARKQQYAWVEP
jgi:CDP-glucose 4,6-dehydratase